MLKQMAQSDLSPLHPPAFFLPSSAVASSLNTAKLITRRPLSNGRPTSPDYSFSRLLDPVGVKSMIGNLQVKMEVAVAEEKKKIFRARKTMKISDRQQLESLHSTLSSPVPPLSNSNSSSPPPRSPLTNGTHTEDAQKGADREQNDVTVTSRSTTPVSPTSLTSRSPPLALSLSLSPSPPTSQSPKAKEDATPSPSSPFHNLNDVLKKMEEEGKKSECSTSPSNKDKEGKDTEMEVAKTDEKEEKAPETEKEEACTTTGKSHEDQAPMDQYPLDSPFSPVSLAMSDKESGKEKMTEQKEDTVAMETDTDKDHTETKASEASTSTEEKPSSPKAATMAPPVPTPSPSAAPEPDQDIKEELVKKGEKKKDDSQKEKEGVTKEEKMEVVSVKKEMKKEKQNVAGCSTSSLVSSTSTSTSDKGVKVKEEKSSSSGQKRPLLEGDEKDGGKVERDGKRQKVQGVELEAQLELKITAKGGSRLKLEKVLQKMVEERLRALQLTVFDQGLQELKDRVEKIDCATKHQSTLNTLQAKIARLAKKFGEANQASENKRKQEALTSPVAKAAPATNTIPTQRAVAAVVKQPMTSPVSTNLTVTPVKQPKPVPTTTTATAMVTQGSILQLIPTSSSSASLCTVTSQSGPTGTLLLKTTSGSNVVGQNGQPLLIQLPLSAMANGGAGTLVNIPVSSFAAVNSLNKAKTTTPTTTYILKAGPTTSTTSTMALQPISTTQLSPAMSPAQMTLARAVYQGGTGGISTPSAGMSVTTARAPVQASSGPAATGSAAPGPPSGTAMTSKTDNQATSSTPTKKGARPKGSFIDLTEEEEEEEEDDDVLVTGVRKAITTAVSSSSVTQRSTGPPPLISTPSGTTSRASPQQSVGGPHLTVHYRPPLDSPSKARMGNNTTPTKPPPVTLPPLPLAPLPPGRLPMEANQTTPPQQPQLKLARVQNQNGIVLSWCVAETDLTCAGVESYHLYAYHQDNAGSVGNGPGAGQHWKKIGEVKALPLPMACTLTQFVSGSTYYFAVRARDVYGRFGTFCEPQCTDVISATTPS
ncbi:activating transcription factor 7-interacting protein 1 isoform X2 [Salvelinus fontinalis]|uniref:activating transcription factor 7-interacting protein 1 isoform X2 n=1 Tax=Salvelinus fontinalis TaxID=8038 RepID=UPI00248608BA|nr:activating transcription factor 7-interacting protein 1 isoform X2 [Salvelinus fontinalis]